MREIVLPEIKPALEWIAGRAVQKVSPRRRHALAQTRFAAALIEWAEISRAGDVGTEWEFRVQPPGEERRPLVPDVAYLSFDRVPYDEAGADTPRVAPDAVVEILSPGDRKSDIEEKIRVYLAAGTHVIFLVNTQDRTVTIRDASGARVLTADDMIAHLALPGFTMPVRRLFERPRPKHAA